MPTIAEFQIVYRLSSPSGRTPRRDQPAVERAFPGENCRFLGSGSFGDTWRIGEHAVKIIMEDSFPPERIEREIEAARVDHANVVRLDEVREVDLSGDKRVALLFRFVKGHDLATLVSRNGPLDEAGLRALAQGLFAGLAAIHAEGVIHRDIKPENIQLRMDSAARPVILDLGLAHVADLSSLTTYPAAIGTRAFMAPEVLRGEHALARSDVFAVGVSLYIAATGRHPWLTEGKAVTSTQFAALIAGGPPAFTLSDDALAEAIVDCLDPKAFRRPSAERVVDRLRDGQQT